MKRIVCTALAVIALLGTAEPVLADGTLDVKEFKKQFSNTQNSWERRALIQKLDPTNAKALKILKAVLQDPRFSDWYYRQGAIDVLASAYDPGLIGKLEKVKKPLLIEAVALAFGRSKNKDRVPWIIKQLKSKKWVVRRAAALALRKIPDKRSIGPLIECWEEESKFTVWIHILETLERITRQKDMDTPEKWADWWSVNKDSFEVGKDAGDELSEDEKSGNMIRTRVRGTNLTLRSRGQGLPLLVIPAYGFEKNYLETYLRNLEDTNKIFYLKLPGVADLCANDSCSTKGCSHGPLPNAPNAPHPFYPLERIGNALETLFKQLKDSKAVTKKFAILAHGGLSTWLAMNFAIKHRKAVRRMILIGASSGNKAAGEGIKNIIRTGQQRADLEMEHYGLSRQIENGKPKYQSSGDDERWALNRKQFTVWFGDPRNLEIGRLYGPLTGVDKVTERGRAPGMPKWQRPMGSLIYPDFSLFKLDRVGTPVMVMTGQFSIEFTKADAQAIARHYGGNARVVPFKKSGAMPFIEENEKFVKIVRKWLGGKRARKKKRKKRKKRRKK